MVKIVLQIRRLYADITISLSKRRINVNLEELTIVAVFCIAMLPNKNTSVSAEVFYAIRKEKIAIPDYIIFSQNRIAAF